VYRIFQFAAHVYTQFEFLIGWCHDITKRHLCSDVCADAHFAQYS
jgi:hypothetical protein